MRDVRDREAHEREPYKREDDQREAYQHEVQEHEVHEHKVQGPEAREPLALYDLKDGVNMNLVAAQPLDLSVIRNLHVPTRHSATQYPTARQSTVQRPAAQHPATQHPVTASVGHAPLKRAAPVKDLESLGPEYVTGIGSDIPEIGRAHV